MAGGSGSGSDPGSFTVNDRNKNYYKSGDGPPVDSLAMTDTPPPAARWGQEAPESATRQADAPVEAVVPDIRKSARTAEDVDRSRPREMPAWFGPLVGVVTFVVVLGGGLFLMTVYFSYQVVVAPVPPPEPVVPTELEGVPVRKGLGSGDDQR
jgi:hypothetical protein